MIRLAALLLLAASPALAAGPPQYVAGPATGYQYDCRQAKQPVPSIATLVTEIPDLDGDGLPRHPPRHPVHHHRRPGMPRRPRLHPHPALDRGAPAARALIPATSHAVHATHCQFVCAQKGSLTATEAPA
jgi:hypothetical protein